MVYMGWEQGMEKAIEDAEMGMLRRWQSLEFGQLCTHFLEGIIASSKPTY